MSRVGTNPLKWIGINKRPKKITIVTIVYIPELSIYIPESFLMVLDNGSSGKIL